MIDTVLHLDYRGQLYDIIAQGKVDIDSFQATIEFPAPYALYAFEAHNRNIRRVIAERWYHVSLTPTFREVYRQTLSVRQALIAARADLLETIRKQVLRAPAAPPPPAKNPFKDRLRRITGRLSDTARTPRLKATRVIPGTEERIDRDDLQARKRIQRRYYSASRREGFGPTGQRHRRRQRRRRR